MIDRDGTVDTPAMRGEWAKFESIVAASEGWRPALERLEAIVAA